MKRKTKKNETRNARFWLGDVKVTLVPGQTIRWETGSPTDEGWRHTEYILDYDGPSGIITREEHESGADCDGRYEYHNVRSVHVFHLKDVWNEYIGEWQPAWERVDRRSYQRDYSAEAMGY